MAAPSDKMKPPGASARAAIGIGNLRTRHPLAHEIRAFVWGTFLGLNPYTNRRCASNGVLLFSKSW